MSTRTQVFLVRHGQSRHNQLKLIQGQTHSRLTSQGKRETTTAAHRLANLEFQHLYSSDLKRAHQTAEILADKLSDQNRTLPLTLTKALREKTLGQFEEMPIQTFRAHFAEQYRTLEQLSEQDLLTFRMHPDFETHAETANRVLEFLEQVSIKHPGQRILAVSHSGTIVSLLLAIGHLTRQKLSAGFGIANAGHVVLEHAGEGWRVVEKVN